MPLRLSSHRLPFSLSIGGAPPPEDVEGGGPNVWRQQRGTVRMALRMGARTRVRMRAGGSVRLAWALTGATRRRIGDELWLLGLGSDEDALLFGAVKAVVKKDAVDRLLDSVDAEARRWAEEATTQTE